MKLRHQGYQVSGRSHLHSYAKYQNFWRTVWYRAPQYTMSNLWINLSSTYYYIYWRVWIEPTFKRQANVVSCDTATRDGYVSRQRRSIFLRLQRTLFFCCFFFQAYLFGKIPSIEEIHYALFKAKVCNDSECINNEAVFNVIEKVVDVVSEIHKVRVVRVVRHEQRS